MIGRFLSVIVTIACLVAIGVASGVITDRWGVSVDVVAAAGRLNSIPMQIDGWTGTDVQIDQRQLDGAGALGSMSRVYQSPDRMHLVSVTILCGRHGPIATHEPTVCFVGSGMKQVARERGTTIEHGSAHSSFRTAEFSSPTPGEPVQQTFWGWSRGADEWSTPENPRIEFASAKALYKLYFVTPVSVTKSEKTQAETDPAVLRFMSSFLAQLPESLKVDSPKPASSGRS